MIKFYVLNKLLRKITKPVYDTKGAINLFNPILTCLVISENYKLAFYDIL